LLSTGEIAGHIDHGLFDTNLEATVIEPEAESLTAPAPRLRANQLNAVHGASSRPEIAI